MDCIPKTLMSSDLAYKIVESYPYALSLIPDEFITYETCLVAARRGYLENIPFEHRTLELCTIAVPIRTITTDNLMHVPDEILTVEFLKNMIENHGPMLHAVPDALKTMELCEISVYRFAHTFEFVPKPLRSRHICLTALRNNEYACKYRIQKVPLELLDEEMCLAAVTSAPGSLEFIPPHLRTDAVRKAATHRR